MPHPLDFKSVSRDRCALSDYKRTQARYDACHDDDDFTSLKRRAAFSRESAGLYRQWMQAATCELSNEQGHESAFVSDLGATIATAD